MTLNVVPPVWETMPITCHKIRSIAISLLLIVFSNTNASASMNGPALRVSLDQAWHPLSYLDSNNRPQGVLIDYWKLIAKKMGRKVEFQLVDWQQSLDQVRDNRADVHGGLFQSVDREQYLSFSDDILPLSTRLFVSAGLNARQFSDLKSTPVGITRGGYEVEVVKEQFPSTVLKYYNNNQKLVTAALAGEVQAFVADYPVGMYYLHKLGSPEKYQVVYTLYTQQLKTAVLKENTALLNEINAALRLITKEEKDNITQKWIRTEKVVPPWVFTSLAVFIVSLLIAAGLAYTVLLRIQVRRKTRQLQKEYDESVRLRNENLALMAELKKQKEEAEQANIAKSKFLAAASHDLRQPLHALSLFTSVLDESIQYPKVRRVVEQIQSSVQALQYLFNALLDISRLEAGVMQVETCDFDLQDIIKKLINDFTPQAQEKNLKLYWPEQTGWVKSDPALLEQILRNYLSNAIRYTDNGSVTVYCRKDTPDTLTICVQDTGSGIPGEEQQAIFKEFHQLGNYERDRSKGLGLGLAIVQRTAQLLGHTVSLESEPGSGSTFCVVVTEGCESQPEITSELHSVQLPASNKKCIAIIDDDGNVLEGMQSLLRIWGYQVIAASDKTEVLKQIRQASQTPDAIIADYRLRDKQSGLDVIRAIHKETNTTIPALIITGDIAVEQLRDVDESGYPVLHKPVPPARLRAFLQRLNTSLH